MNYKEAKGYQNVTWIDRCKHAMAKNKQCSYILW